MLFRRPPAIPEPSWREVEASGRAERLEQASGVGRGFCRSPAALLTSACNVRARPGKCCCSLSLRVWWSGSDRLLRGSRACRGWSLCGLRVLSFNDMPRSSSYTFRGYWRGYWAQPPVARTSMSGDLIHDVLGIVCLAAPYVNWGTERRLTVKEFLKVQGPLQE